MNHWMNARCMPNEAEEQLRVEWEDQLDEAWAALDAEPVEEHSAGLGISETLDTKDD